jgi:hypothetical protein
MPLPRPRITMRQLMLGVLVFAVLNGGLAWLAGQVRRTGRGTPEQIEARTWWFTLFVNLTVAAIFLIAVIGKWLGAVRRHRLGLTEPALPTLAKLRSATLFNILLMTAISVSNMVSREGWNILTERGLLSLALVTVASSATGLAVHGLFYAFHLAGRPRLDPDPSEVETEGVATPCPAETTGESPGEQGHDEADA